jgi:hypothetical protein
VIRIYDEAGNVIETHEQAGDFKEWRATRDYRFVQRFFRASAVSAASI